MSLILLIYLHLYIEIYLFIALKYSVTYYMHYSYHSTNYTTIALQMLSYIDVYSNGVVYDSVRLEIIQDYELNIGIQ